MSSRPYVNTTATVRDDLDPLAAVPVITISARDLRAGMILVDPVLGTPIGEVDHKMRAARGSGLVSFLMFDFDARTWTSESVHANGTVNVMATA